MKKVLSLFVVLTILLWSCNGGENNAAKTSEVVVTHKDMNSEVNKTVANISIEGMTCSAGCGGKIQQDLRALKGVANTTLDFADGRSENTVSVEYNPSEINETDFIKCVNAIADGQYHVKAVEIVSYKGLQTARTGGSSDVRADNFGRVFKLFNFLQSAVGWIGEHK